MGGEVTIKLRQPVQFGKGSPAVEELVLRPTARALRDLSITLTETGGVKFEPYPLARIGLKMAAQGGDTGFLDLMDVRDLVEVARVVLGFMEPDQETGKTA